MRTWDDSTGPSGGGIARSPCVIRRLRTYSSQPAPDLADISSDPRFKALVRKMNLPG
jgi:hypothetical protein